MPTVEQPLREAEFDELFSRFVRGVERVEPGRLRLELEPTAEVAATAADLVVRETGCCSFFTFALIATGGGLRLEISVPDKQRAVLDVLSERAGR